AVAENNFVSSEAFKSVLSVYNVDETIDENLPKSFLAKDALSSLESISRQRKAGNPFSTSIGLYNYLKAVYKNSPSKVSTDLLADLSLLVASKQVEWENLEWLIWRHLSND